MSTKNDNGSDDRDENLVDRTADHPDDRTGDRADRGDDDLIAHALDAWTPMQPPAGFADRVLAARMPLAPSVARSKRAWWLAAPVLAAAMIALVFFFSTQTMSKATSVGSNAAEGRGATNAQMVALDQVAAGSSDTAAMGSGSAMGSAAIAMNQPVSDAGVAIQPLPSLVDEPATDLAVIAGTSVTIHDPTPGNDRPVVLHVDFTQTCPSGAEVSVLDRGHVIAPATGRTRARLTVYTGSWTYEVRCVDAPSTVAATGTIKVVVDAATRRLPKITRAVNTVEADGRTWRVSYPVVPPEIHVTATGATHVRYSTNGIETEVPVVGRIAKLRDLTEGTYTYWAVTPSGRGKLTTLIVDFDHTVPQLYLGSVRTTKGVIVVEGSVLPGWTLATGGEPIALRGNRTFEATVRGFTRLVIRAEHPKLGIHYFATLPITR
jgi:hypothetical protein